MALATTSLKDPFVPRRSGRIALVKRHRFNNNNSGVPSGSTSSCFYHHASTVGRKRSNKSVHFSQDIEQVRLFSQSDTPVEVQATTASRLEFQNWSPTIPSPPSSLSSASARRRYSRKPDATVCLENLELRGNMNDFSLRGTCRVANLAFEKHVLVRYTTDDWQTFHDVEARFQASIHGGAWDRFAFDLKLVGPNYQGQRQHHILQLAIRYAVNNCHFWDNNDGKDYRVAVIPDSGRQSNHPSSPTSWSLSSYFWQHVAKSLQ
ncbi:putative phosphatase regulatory subunit-domain-containing protein [Syncephalastrum racemosum]|uniref:Putative phosphatase regulatory subunit-domain-containing protein n=1 Tax=Syncephalastrum racemosum TaxID=13706 RepID=A0A1X2H403_SYNRA|nr:putative phosphatase regulatory subunit-domain-containing protein [Syncephalastrum racemosum]